MGGAFPGFERHLGISSVMGGDLSNLPISSLNEIVSRTKFSFQAGVVVVTFVPGAIRSKATRKMKRASRMEMQFFVVPLAEKADAAAATILVVASKRFVLGATMIVICRKMGYDKINIPLQAVEENETVIEDV